MAPTLPLTPPETPEQSRPSSPPHGLDDLPVPRYGVVHGLFAELEGAPAGWTSGRLPGLPATGGLVLTPPQSDDDEFESKDSKASYFTVKKRPAGGTLTQKPWSAPKSVDLDAPVASSQSSPSQASSHPHLRILTAIAVALGAYLLALSSWKLPPSASPSGKPAHWQTHPARHSVVLYTILGSDLPPRHAANQTLTNLAFLLSHETLSPLPPLPSLPLDTTVERRFLLNRILPGDSRDQIVSLLQKNGKTFDEIPFVEDEWRSVPVNWTGLAGGGGKWAFGGERTMLMEDSELEVDPARLGWKELDWSLEAKNKYAMNNNGARNHALSLAFSSPSTRYAVPLDSNCALTTAGLAALLQTIVQSEASASPSDYVTIPMARLLSNDDFAVWNRAVEWDSVKNDSQVELALGSLRPEAPAEAQIAFRFSATQHFDPSFRYGRRPKLSLLWSLGAVPFSRDLHTKTFEWEAPDRSLTPASFRSLAARTVEGGWTMRLFSGDGRQEGEDEVAQTRRKTSRAEGVVSFLERLEVEMARPLERKAWGFKTDYPESTLAEWDAHLLTKDPNLWDEVPTVDRDTVEGYAFPLLSPPPAAPEHYLFLRDPYHTSPLTLLQILSLPSTTPADRAHWDAYVRSQYHYLLFSAKALRVSAQSPAQVSLVYLARYDLSLCALAFYLEDWPTVARIAQRVGLRIQILLKESERLSLDYEEWGYAWKLWDAVGDGLDKSGWRGWTFRAGEWEFKGQRYSWPALERVLGEPVQGDLR